MSVECFRAGSADRVPTALPTTARQLHPYQERPCRNPRPPSSPPSSSARRSSPAAARKPSDKTCTAAYINEIAQKEGVEKAKSLSAACLEQGYDKAMNDLQKAGDAIKEKLFGEKK